MSIIKRISAGVLTLALMFLGFTHGTESEPNEALEILWQIGTEDRDTADLALGPDGYDAFKLDAFFVVGKSKAETDWPYVHPGPSDAWAGNRPHTYSVVFGLSQIPRQDACTLEVAWADTHPGGPPRIEIVCNGETIAEQALPRGASDDSIRGNPKAGRSHHFSAIVPTSALRKGDNILEIKNVEGSWMLYDSICFRAPEDARLADVRSECVVTSIKPLPFTLERDGNLYRQLSLELVNTGPNVRANCVVDGRRISTFDLESGRHQITIEIPEPESESSCLLVLETDRTILASQKFSISPAREWVIHLLHHTHLDIGFTHTQDQVEQLQIQYLDEVQELIRDTDDYPRESQFIWLPEGLWAVESYLKQADEEKRTDFINAVKAGRIGLDALYGNALTGLYSEEELFALLDYAVRLRSEYDLPIDSAMISDVPGYTWGLVPVLAQSGIKYLSIGPNPGHRIGWTRVWDDQPFYWVSPSGDSRVLCWFSGKSYNWFHTGLVYDRETLPNKLTEDRIADYLLELEEKNYPYDMLHLRYVIGADNGPPDPKLCGRVKAWNERYVSPKIIITTTSRMFRDLEARYGDKIPVVSGDFTPYWEDGAASTAADTATNRNAVETLVRAQALWAMLQPDAYPADRVYAGWRNAVLYDEHTWGAWNSISDPDNPFAMKQAEIKQQFALDANVQAHRILDDALANRRASDKKVKAVEVFNTHSWSRTDLIVLPVEMDIAGDSVTAEDGTQVPSQRLSSGELAFLAKDIPPIGSMRFTIHPRVAKKTGHVIAEGTRLNNGLIGIQMDERTGAIVELRAVGIKDNLVECDGEGIALNDYIYVNGRDPGGRERIESTKIRILDRGPLVATVQVESSAPGANGLIRQVRLIDGLNRVDITNIIDKRAVREKEGVHFAFPFSIADPTVRMDMPWSVVRPEADQMVGACRNFFSVQRWVDMSNLTHGITWATVDAPLVQMGAIRTDVPAPNSTEGWLKHIETSPKLFSYVMNNYWETNYKADQSGLVTFRYSIQPHLGVYVQSQAARFGVERCQPLIAIPAKPDGPPALASLLKLDSPGVMVTSLKPSRDRKAWIVRLYAVSGKPETVRLRWSEPAPSAIYLCGPDQSRGARVEGPVALPAYGIVTLRAERT